MRVSQFFISTLKEAPADAELISHKLMVRAGLIKRLASGLYTWMPLGLRVLRKVETIVREEMDRSGAIELLMPAVQPAELWQESKRWECYGPELLRIKDRHQRDFCFGPTHEEVITDVVRREIKSYKQLPVNLYQIQTKFRDEIRPRFGVMRAREFLMKDAYSFHIDRASLEETYRHMFDAYTRIFFKLGLQFRAVAADTGAIGGTGSHEFHVLADSGEDAIAFCPHSDYAANIDLAEALAPDTPRPPPNQNREKVATPEKRTIEEVSSFLQVSSQRMVKTLVAEGTQGHVALLVRGNHMLNEVKVSKLPQIKTPLRWASEEDIRKVFGAGLGSIGPVFPDQEPLRQARRRPVEQMRKARKALTVIADRSVAAMSDWVCGANQDGYHYIGVNFGRDVPEPLTADIRNVIPGDPSPDGRGPLEICRGIEVGHVFQLGTKYSKPMNVIFVDETGQNRIMEMGCYGIGVSRIVAAAIEQGHDERGIVFPRAMAPFELALIPIGMKKNPHVKQMTDKLYDELSTAGIEVLLDDRDERTGVMFADAELIGIPHRLVIGERALAKDEVEYQGRQDTQASMIPIKNVLEFIQSRLAARP